MMRILFLFLVGLMLLGTSAQAQQAEPDIYLQKDLTKDVQFPGGHEAMMKFFEDNMVYPPAAKEQGKEGSVFVRLIIDKNGAIYSSEIAMAFHPLFEDEALRLVMSMPNWIPAEINGQQVATTKMISIPFKLNP